MYLDLYVCWAFALFLISLAGLVATQPNLIFLLLAAEIALLSANLVFIVSSVFFQDITGQLFSLFILTVAASESAIGLAIFILFFKQKGSLSYLFVNLLKA